MHGNIRRLLDRPTSAIHGIRTACIPFTCYSNLTPTQFFCADDL